MLKADWENYSIVKKIKKATNMQSIEDRRWELIYKEIHNELTIDEANELAFLQREVCKNVRLNYRKKPMLIGDFEDFT